MGSSFSCANANRYDFSGFEKPIFLRSRHSIGFPSASCYLSQFQDSATYAKTLFKLYAYDPVEVLSRLFEMLPTFHSQSSIFAYSGQIIVSSTTVEPVKSKLVRLIVDQMDVELVPVARKAFNSDAGWIWRGFLPFWRRIYGGLFVLQAWNSSNAMD